MPLGPRVTRLGRSCIIFLRVRIAYVVVSHRNPEQALRLVAALREGPAGEVLVRHDGRRSHLDEAELERLGALALHDDVEFEWGGWSQLQLLLGCLRQAAEELDRPARCPSRRPTSSSSVTHTGTIRRPGARPAFSERSVPSLISGSF